MPLLYKKNTILANRIPCPPPPPEWHGIGFLLQYFLFSNQFEVLYCIILDCILYCETVELHCEIVIYLLPEVELF